MIPRFLRATVAATVVAASAAPLYAQPTLPTRGNGTVVLRAARLIDGTGAAPVQNGVVVVTDDRIVAVGREGSVQVPAGARVIDLGDATLLPGFIDMHTHITGRALGDAGSDWEAVRDLPAFSAILGAANARATLMAGFTTIRNLGSADFADVALRQAIDQGYVPGPRIQAAGNSLGITGGHCDTNGFRPGLLEGDYRTGVADGADQIVAAVRYQAKYGADVIKTCATAGVLSEGVATVGSSQYSLEELQAMVAEARNLDGRKVAAHAHGTAGIKLAVRAGVASIEHVNAWTKARTERPAAAGARAGTPFFLSLHYTAPHWPWETRDDAHVAAHPSGLRNQYLQLGHGYCRGRFRTPAGLPGRSKRSGSAIQVPAVSSASVISALRVLSRTPTTGRQSTPSQTSMIGVVSADTPSSASTASTSCA